MSELAKSYEEFIQSIPADISERSLLYSDFLANEFSKETINHDYDYMISAIFSELTVDSGYDGIIYPSVRVEGMGLNVAIRPESMHKLKLCVAGENHLYKNKMQMFMDNGDLIENLNGLSENFILNHVDIDHRHNLEYIGLNSLDPIK
jgi:hypothetical protein